ncbi:MAG: diaminopimelate decarboxylase, partial [Mogibacterium sp.]|nr:diaminopimelate decarboxylase [Mogibacterium sp.]
KMVKEAFGESTDICYSIKANPFLLSVLPEEYSKIEVCSPGELEICKALHIDPAKIIFSGVSKSQAEVDTAIDYGVRILTAESENHLRYISRAASDRGVIAEVLLRLSCESQFGMDKSDIYRIIADRDSYPGTDINGIHYFTGTQKTRPKEIIKEITRLKNLIDRLEEELDFTVECIEYGTGLAVDYFADDADDKEAARLSDISECIRELSERVELTVEMGRFFAAPCGWLVNTVVDTKFNDGTHYAILDGGLHQMKYDGQIQGMQIPVITHIPAEGSSAGEEEKWTLCGSLCTTADVIARGVLLTNLSEGDRIVFHRTGAYSVYEGFSMFLSRDLPSVYILDDSNVLRLVRSRIETACFNTAEGLI